MNFEKSKKFQIQKILIRISSHQIPKEELWGKIENLAMAKENIKNIKKLMDPRTGRFWTKKRDRFLATRKIKMIVIIELKSLIIRERMVKHMDHIKQKSEDKLLGNGTLLKNIAKLLRNY